MTTRDPGSVHDSDSGPLAEPASRLAQAHLYEQLPRRWTHVQAVAAKAHRVARALDEPDRDTLIAAAWLHDIGYAEGLAVTGFHPLDGARFLRTRHFDPRVTGLVAHHSCALIEADERGLRQVLISEFRREESATADALCYCDMTTGPDGQDLPIAERLDEIRTRYGPEHVVTRFIHRARKELLAAVERTEDRLVAGRHKDRQSP